MTHCRSVKVPPRSSRIDGSATLTTVMSSNSMNVATETATRVHHFRAMSPRDPDTGRRFAFDLPQYGVDTPAPRVGVAHIPGRDHLLGRPRPARRGGRARRAPVLLAGPRARLLDQAVHRRPGARGALALVVAGQVAAGQHARRLPGRLARAPEELDRRRPRPRLRRPPDRPPQPQREAGAHAARAQPLAARPLPLPRDPAGG